jgi:hypothetical protein
MALEDVEDAVHDHAQSKEHAEEIADVAPEDSP